MNEGWGGGVRGGTGRQRSKILDTSCKTKKEQRGQEKKQWLLRCRRSDEGERPRVAMFCRTVSCDSAGSRSEDGQHNARPAWPGRCGLTCCRAANTPRPAAPACPTRSVHVTGHGVITSSTRSTTHNYVMVRCVLTSVNQLHLCYTMLPSHP